MITTEPLIGLLVAQSIGVPLSAFGVHWTCMGILDGMALRAGAIYHHYTVMEHGSEIELSIAVKDRKCIGRRELSAMFKYPFDVLKVDRLQVTTSTARGDVKALLRRLGFVHEGELRRAYDGRDAKSVFSMLPSECKWIR